MKSGPEMTVIPKSGNLWKKITTHKCFNIFYKYYGAKTHVIDPKYPDPYTKVIAVPQDSGLSEQIRQLSEGITDTL